MKRSGKLSERVVGRTIREASLPDRDTLALKLDDGTNLTISAGEFGLEFSIEGVVRERPDPVPDKSLSDEKPVWKVEDFAARWSMSRGRVYELIRTGELASFRLGKLVRIKMEEIRRYETRGVTPA